jgi:hypothetical protein
LLRKRAQDKRADPVNQALIPGNHEVLDETHAQVPRGELTLAGPSDRSDRARLPVRGDLAHIRLAGRYFVPHYVLPLSHRVSPAGATLLAAGKDGATVLAVLESGTVFEVLDVAGSWAWGQVGADGLVGYLAVAMLDPI